MEKKITSQEGLNPTAEDLIQNLDDGSALKNDSFSIFEASYYKDARLEISKSNELNSLPYEAIHYDYSCFRNESKVIFPQSRLVDSVLQIGRTGYFTGDSKVLKGFQDSTSPWVVSNPNNLESGTFKVDSGGYLPVEFGAHLKSRITGNHLAVSNFTQFDRSTFQFETTGYLGEDSVVQLSSQISSSPWVVSNQIKLENQTFQVGNMGFSPAVLGVHSNSNISKSHLAVSNFTQFDKDAFQVERSHSIVDSIVRLSSQVSSRPWFEPKQNTFENDVLKIRSFGYSPAIAGIQINSRISESNWAVSGLNHFDYNGEVFKLGTTKYSYAGSMVAPNFKQFENLWINPKNCHSEFGMLQKKKTEYPWLASNLSSGTVLSGSFLNDFISGANVTRTSIIDHNDNGLFNSVDPFRVYEPLDNHTLNTLKNTIESTIQKFKGHNPIQKYSLGFEKGKQITLINIFIVQGDVKGDNHHFGDNIYYLAQ